ncbi:hypothetical protein ACFQ4X_14310 [Fictibacillus halophilus]|uniref:hypothetical protein n=1 Tax=Fictibacillus halophilus TaxID=1610490 RepID=UPI00363F5AC4
MLIKLDDSLIICLKNDLDNFNHFSPEIKSLNNIAKAYYEGYHVISVDSIELLEMLVQIDVLEEVSKRIYQSLLDKFVFLPAYEEFCSDYILVKGNDFNFSRIENKQQCIFEVPLNHFSVLQSISATSLVSEDLSDCLFYEKLAKKYIQENKNHINFNLSLSPTPGNGDGTCKLYEYKLKSKFITFVIADSDKTYPEDTVGNTLSKINTIYSANKNGSITNVYELTVREKENLISPSLYLLCANNSIRGTLTKLKKIEESESLSTKLKYIDLKDGIKAKTLKSNETRKKYLEDLFNEVSDLFACSYDEIEDKHDEYPIINGIGSALEDFYNDILGDGLEKKLTQKKKVATKFRIPEESIKNIELNVIKKQNLFKLVPNYIKDDLEFICKKIISWGCSSEFIA